MPTGFVTNSTHARSVMSSGGAAGGCVSEGQGYGLLAAAGAYIGSDCGENPPDKTKCDYIADRFYELFLGWQQMAKATTGHITEHYCVLQGESVPCVVNWKFTNDLKSVWNGGQGSATDGDVDAATGIALMALATGPDHYPWFDEVGHWAYGLCKQIYETDTSSTTKDGKHSEFGFRITKGGSDWDAFTDDSEWNGMQNPSYHAPAAYQLCGRYMQAYQPSPKYRNVVGDVPPVEERQWKEVVSTSYRVIQSCVSREGLVPNWFEFYQDGRSGRAKSGRSGTPANQYGSEATRNPLRIAMHHAMFAKPDGSNDDYIIPDFGKDSNLEKKEKYTSKEFLETIMKTMSGAPLSDLASGASETPLPTHPPLEQNSLDWRWNGFMYGPLASTMIVSKSPQDVNTFGQYLDSGPSGNDWAWSNQNYFSFSLICLSTMILNGDFSKARSWIDSVDSMMARLKGTGCYGDKPAHCQEVLPCTSGKYMCKTCNEGYDLDSNTGTCVSSCSGDKPTIRHCDSVVCGASGNWTCSKCETGFKLDGGKRVSSCSGHKPPIPHCDSVCARKWSQDKSSCFPGHARVDTPEGEIRMDQVQIGTLVRDSSGSDTYSAVIGFLHRSTNVASTKYLSLTFTNGQQLDISPNHRIFLSDGSDNFAKDLHVGSAMAAGQVVSQIENVEHNSLFAPVTESGMVVVDGILASCYADLPHAVAHSVISHPLRIYNWFSQMYWQGIFSERWSKPMPVFSAHTK